MDKQTWWEVVASGLFWILLGFLLAAFYHMGERAERLRHHQETMEEER